MVFHMHSLMLALLGYGLVKTIADGNLCNRMSQDEQRSVTVIGLVRIASSISRALHSCNLISLRSLGLYACYVRTDVPQ